MVFGADVLGVPEFLTGSARSTGGSKQVPVAKLEVLTGTSEKPGLLGNTVFFVPCFDDGRPHLMDKEAPIDQSMDQPNAQREMFQKMALWHWWWVAGGVWWGDARFGW